MRQFGFVAGGAALRPSAFFIPEPLSGQEQISQAPSLPGTSQIPPGALYFLVARIFVHSYQWQPDLLEELFFSGLIGSVQIDSVIPYILNMQVLYLEF